MDKSLIKLWIYLIRVFFKSKLHFSFKLLIICTMIYRSYCHWTKCRWESWHCDQCWKLFPVSWWQCNWISSNHKSCRWSAEHKWKNTCCYFEFKCQWICSTFFFIVVEGVSECLSYQYPNIFGSHPIISHTVICTVCCYMHFVTLYTEQKNIKGMHKSWALSRFQV